MLVPLAPAPPEAASPAAPPTLLDPPPRLPLSHALAQTIAAAKTVNDRRMQPKAATSRHKRLSKGVNVPLKLRAGTAPAGSGDQQSSAREQSR